MRLRVEPAQMSRLSLAEVESLRTELEVAIRGPTLEAQK